MKTIALFSLLFFTLPFADEIDNNILFEAMADELNRNISSLRIEKQTKPYYIAYRIVDAEVIEITATFGSIVSNNHRHSRDLYVDVRVGDYQLDNSNFVCQTRHSHIIGADHSNLPLDDNYDVIRNDIWLATDGTYKKALEKLSRKRATIQNRQIEDEIQDFSKVARNEIIEPLVSINTNCIAWKDSIILISKAFKKFPKIYESSITFYSKAANIYFLDSENNRCRYPSLVTYVKVTAKTQSDDGDPLELNIGFYCHTPEELPKINSMINKVEAMAETLSMQTSLKKEEDYSGPVLFMGQATAELFFQVLGKGVSDVKPLLYENEMLSKTAGGKDMGMLTHRFQRRVMPDFLSAYDDPNLTKWHDIPLVGHFSVDDQGVVAQKVDIVKEGRLVGVLTSRAPIKKVKTSNGHGRYQSGRFGPRITSMVGNLVVESRDKKDIAELKKKLINICKDFDIPYGIVITRLDASKKLTTRDRYMRYWSAMNPGSEKQLLSSPVVAYRIDTETGAAELIRGLEFASVTPRVLRDIVATGDDDYVYNFLYYDSEGNEYPMSIIAPSVLVEEIDLVTKDTKPEKQPILSHPFFTK